MTLLYLKSGIVYGLFQMLHRVVFESIKQKDYALRIKTYVLLQGVALRLYGRNIIERNFLESFIVIR